MLPPLSRALSDWIESQNLTMAGLDPDTKRPRVGAANDSVRSRTLACWVTGSEAGHGEEGEVTSV